MFKNLLTSLSVMLFAFCMSSNAQNSDNLRSDKPVHKVCIEEFAYNTCAYCPKGMIAFEKMRQLYGEDIILISMHDRANNDPMYCPNFMKYEDAHYDSNQGYPNVYINRNSEKSLDPYFGSSFETDDISKRVLFGIKDDIEKELKRVPTANIDASFTMNGNMITATASVRFFFSGNASDYGIAYILTADGLTNPEWIQVNGLSKNETYIEYAKEEPLFEPWVKGESTMYDVVFDDIAIAGIGIENGIEGSIPATVEEGKVYNHSVTIDLSKNPLVQDKNKLRLITLLINNKEKIYKQFGRIENANSILINEKTGIDNVFEKGQAVEKARYTIDGRRINAPEKGINIIKYTDGRIKKVVVK